MPDKTGPLQENGLPDLPLEEKPRRPGTFRPGKSGNPAGRPKGSRNKLTEFAAALMDGAAEDVVTKLVTLAKAGVPFAIRLVVDRVVPQKRDRRVELVDMRRLSNAADLVEASAQVIGLAASGEISMEEARAFLQLLEQHRKSIEGADLAIKVGVLEAELDAERNRREGRR